MLNKITILSLIIAALQAFPLENELPSYLKSFIGAELIGNGHLHTVYSKVPQAKFVESILIPSKDLPESEAMEEKDIKKALLTEKDGKQYFIWIKHPEDTKYFQALKSDLNIKKIKFLEGPKIKTWPTSSRTLLVFIENKNKYLFVKTSSNIVHGMDHDKMWDKQSASTGLYSSLAFLDMKKEGLLKHVMIWPDEGYVAFKNLDLAQTFRSTDLLKNHAVQTLYDMDLDTDSQNIINRSSRKYHGVNLGLADLIFDLAVYRSTRYFSSHVQNFLYLNKSNDSNKIVLRDTGDIRFSTFFFEKTNFSKSLNWRKLKLNTQKQTFEMGLSIDPMDRIDGALYREKLLKNKFTQLLPQTNIENIFETSERFVSQSIKFSKFLPLANLFKNKFGKKFYELFRRRPHFALLWKLGFESFSKILTNDLVELKKVYEKSSKEVQELLLLDFMDRNISLKIEPHFSDKNKRPKDTFEMIRLIYEIKNGLNTISWKEVDYSKWYQKKSSPFLENVSYDFFNYLMRSIVEHSKITKPMVDSLTKTWKNSVVLDKYFKTAKTKLVEKKVVKYIHKKILLPDYLFYLNVPIMHNSDIIKNYAQEINIHNKHAKNWFLYPAEEKTVRSYLEKDENYKSILSKIDFLFEKNFVHPDIALYSVELSKNLATLPVRKIKNPEFFIERYKSLKEKKVINFELNLLSGEISWCKSLLL